MKKYKNRTIVTKRSAMIVIALIITAFCAGFAYSLMPASDPDIASSVEPIPVVEKMKVSGDTLAYFEEVAMGSEYGDGNELVMKWSKSDVAIAVKGPMTTNDSACLDDVVRDFNLLSSEARLHITHAQGDITINFAPENAFKTIESNYRPINLGYFWTDLSSNMSIYKANILISTTEVTDKERCHLIREELTQSMGLMKDSHKYEDSIFYDDWTETNKYSEIDEQVIKILYGRNNIKPGDNLEAVSKKVLVEENG